MKKHTTETPEMYTANNLPRFSIVRYENKLYSLENRPRKPLLIPHDHQVGIELKNGQVELEIVKYPAQLAGEYLEITTQTGKTPRQLAEINEGLLEALQVIPPERLNDLAEFMDKIDYEKGFKGTEVQDDLRKMAKLSATAIRNATK